MQFPPSTQGSGATPPTSPAGSATPPQISANLWEALNDVLKSGGSVNINISFGPTPTVNG